MMSSRDKSLGKQILSVIDSLVEILILIIKNEGNDSELEAQGCRYLQELLELLEEFIGPNEKYLTEAITELLKQRIPSHILVNRSDDIYNIMAKLYQQVHCTAHLQAAPVVATEEVKKAPENILEKAIGFLFYRYNIIKDYKFRDQVFNYYLPDLKLAIMNGSGKKSNLVSSRCRHRTTGIQVITVDCKNLPCSREIAREIKKQLDITRLSMLEFN
jgi:hypothetical protein